MRILHVVHNFPPEFLGGVERAVLVAAHALRLAGHEVFIVTGSERRASVAHTEETEFEGLPVFRLIRGATFRSAIDPLEPDLIPLYEHVLLRLAPDVVHVHHWWNLGDDLVRRAARRGLPTVVTFHDHFATCAKFFRLPDGATPCLLAQVPDHCGPCVAPGLGVDEREVRARIPSRGQAFAAEARAACVRLAPSTAHAHGVRQFLGDDQLPIEVLGLAAALAPAPPVLRRRTSRDRLSILHFGNLSRIKGVEVLARAVEAADPTGERLLLRVAGESMEGDLDLGRAERLGPYDRALLASFAADADLAVFPSLALESYGLVVDEALALGLPVIVSDRGALSERIGGRGIVVPGGSVLGLADVLRTLLDTPEILSTLAAAERPLVPTPAAHAEALGKVYERAAATIVKVQVDLESPLLQRLSRYQARLHEIFLPGPAGGVAKDPSMATRIGDVQTPLGVDTSGELVSVITRTRNRPELLAEAVASVAAQTHRAVEMIVVNDGGDDPEPVLRPWRDRLRIRTLDPGRVGRCRAANLALNAALGTWIAWLDDDDLYYPNHLERALSTLRTGPAKVLYTDAHRIDQVRDHAGAPWREVGRSVPYSQDFSRLMLFRQAYIHLVTVVHHRSCVETLGGFDESLEVLEDWDLFFRLAQDYDFQHIPEVTSAFRIRSDGSNAVTALRKEFADTRTRLFARYIHVAFPELMTTVQVGREKIAELEARLRRLEGGSP